MHADLPLLDTRRAVRLALRSAGQGGQGETPLAHGEPPLALVALSGGADSLALAAALAHEAPRAGIRAGAVIVDHGLQQESAAVAEQAAAAARALGLAPVFVRTVAVADARAGGPENAARDARYTALAATATSTGARWVLTAHTRSDQAEQVLLGLARGSGLRSLAGIPDRRQLTPACVILRPFLVPEPEITRATTVAACEVQRLHPWQDPQNVDPSYARVRVRDRVLPVLEAELGPGVAAALARSADLAAEDAAVLDDLAEAALARALTTTAQVTLDVAELAALPAALRNRVIRLAALTEFGAHLGREHTAAIAALVASWRGQGPVFVPGMRVAREAGKLVLHPQHGSPRSRVESSPPAELPKA